MGLGKATLKFTKLPHQEWDLPEIPTFIVMGRSNVGKSSLLNALIHPQVVFRTGSRPGVTRGLVGAGVEMGRKELLILDLPGWGFASRANQEMSEWEDLGERLTHKVHSEISKVFWLIDPRREPDAMDLTVFKWMTFFDWEIIFTKSDQVKRGQRRKVMQTWEKLLGEEAFLALWASSKDGEGMSELTKKARTFVRDMAEPR